MLSGHPSRPNIFDASPPPIAPFTVGAPLNGTRSDRRLPAALARSIVLDCFRRRRRKSYGYYSGDCSPLQTAELYSTE